MKTFLIAKVLVLMSASPVFANDIDGWPDVSIPGFIVVVVMIWVICHWVK